MPVLSSAGAFLVFGAMGLIGGVVIILVLKWLGVFDFFNFLNNVLHTVVTYVGRVLSFAPRSVQVMMFVVLGLGILGLVGSLFIAPTYVCASPPAGTGAQDKLYQADSFFSAFAAKMLSSEGEKQQVESEKIAEEASKNWLYTGVIKILNTFGIGLSGKDSWLGMGVTGSADPSGRSMTFGTMIGRWPDVVKYTQMNSSASGQGINTFSEGDYVIFLEHDLNKSISSQTGWWGPVWCPDLGNRSSGQSYWFDKKSCYSKADVLFKWIVSSQNTLFRTTIANGPSQVSGDPSGSPLNANEVALNLMIYRSPLKERFGNVPSGTQMCRIEANAITLDGNQMPQFPSAYSSLTDTPIWSFWEDFKFIRDTNGQLLTSAEVRDITNGKEIGGQGWVLGGFTSGTVTGGTVGCLSGGPIGCVVGAVIGAIAGTTAGVFGGKYFASDRLLSENCVADNRIATDGIRCLTGEWLVYMDSGDYGCVYGQYYKMKDLGVNPDTITNDNIDTVHGAMSARWQYMTNAGISSAGDKTFTEISNQDKGFVKYECSESGDVEARVMGINPFAMSTIVFIAILMLFVWVARLLNLI